MYLTAAQVRSILDVPYFTQQATDSVIEYANYRGRFNAKVYTVRFNLTENFDQTFMNRFLINNLLVHFPLNTRLLGSVQYDLLLHNPTDEENSFYIWRANSNQSNTQIGPETMFFFSYNNIFRIIQKAAQIHIPSLNIFFSTSNVVIERVIAIVFSFVKV